MTDLEKTTTMASNTNPSTTNISHQNTIPLFPDYNRYGPLAQITTASTRLPAFGGELQPGLYKLVKDRKVANPTPRGLFAFAYSVFLLGLIHMQVKDVMLPNIVVGPAFAYGGLVQLCAGMWEMAIGNTFGATVLSSYGGFWISAAIVFTPRRLRDYAHTRENRRPGNVLRFFLHIPLGLVHFHNNNNLPNPPLNPRPLRALRRRRHIRPPRTHIYDPRQVGDAACWVAQGRWTFCHFDGVFGVV